MSELRTTMRIARRGAAVVCLAAAGCGGAASDSTLKTLQPSEAAAAVLQALDGDHDGKLTAAELVAAPGLQAGAMRIDRDKDGVITGEELTQRFEAYAHGSDMIAASIRVLAKGRPVAGASVTLTPEEFMGVDNQTFAGITDASGGCEARAEGKPSPGLPVGYYRVHLVQEQLGIDKILGCELPTTPRAGGSSSA